MLERGDANFFHSKEGQGEKEIEQSEPPSDFGERTIETGQRFEPWAIKSWLARIRDSFRPVDISGSEVLRGKMRQELGAVEKMATRNGVDFSRCQMDKVIEAYSQGKKLEFESFSPYLSDYNLATGEIFRDKLTKADEIGLAIAKMLRDKFTKARIISLYDEYNTDMPDTENFYGAPVKDGPQLKLSDDVKHNFVNSITQLLAERGIIREGDRPEENYKFVSESSKITDAEKLVERLRAKGRVFEEGGALYFVNHEAENPVYCKILLRTKNNRWVCEALDASSYLDPQNLEISHLVVLPNHFKEQQDKVWEILRSLGIQPDNYHNIFFDEKQEPDVVAQTILDEIERYQPPGSGG